MRVLTIVFAMVFALSGCSVSKDGNNIPAPNEMPVMIAVPEKFGTMRDRLVPFFERMGKPSSDEWLARNPESGQTLEQYVNDSPTLPTPEKRTLYILPLGALKPDETRIVKASAEYMEAFFGLPVKVLPGRSFDREIAPENRRISDQTGKRQIKTGHILYDILKPNLPADAASFIAFTNEDLFPDETMNFVFGQATFADRVGVWSFSRLRDDDPAVFLKRVLKIGMHETGHMFSIRHCTKYICLMSGTNHLGETDLHPLDACPECAAKICWMNDCDPAERFGKLAAVARKYGLQDEAASFEAKRRAVAGD